MKNLYAWTDRIAFSGAVALVVFGMLALIAWALHWTFRLSVESLSATMTCDAAICTILAGFSIHHLRRDNAIAARILGCALLTLGLAYLEASFSGSWPCIYRYVPHWTASLPSQATIRNIHMSRAASVLAILHGLAITILSSAAVSKRQFRIVAFCVTGLLAMGAIGLLAGVTGLANDPIWTQSFMAIAFGSALSSLIAAHALLALLIRKSYRQHSPDIPFILTGVGGLSLLLVWAVTQSTSLVYAQIAAQTRGAILSTSSQVAAAYALTRCLRTVETSQRGFLLTQDPVYLGDYLAAVTAVQPALNHLAVFGDRRERCEKLELLTTGKLLELAETVRLEEAGHHEDAVAIVRCNVGRRFTIGIEGERDKLIRELKADLATQLSSDSRSYHLMQKTILWAYGIALVLSGLGIFLVRTAAQQSLRKSEAQLSTIFDSGLVGDFHWDIATGLVTAHPSVWSMFGSPVNLRSAPVTWFRERRDPEDVSKLQAAIEGALSGARPLDLEYRILHPDGTVHWISVVGTITRDADGNALTAQGLNIDISARKHS